MLCNKEVKKRLVPIKTNVTAPASAAAVAWAWAWSWASQGKRVVLGQYKQKNTDTHGYLTERVHVQVLHIDPGLR